MSGCTDGAPRQISSTNHADMSLSIYWTLVERSQVDLIRPEAFLSPAELQKLGAMRFPKRRGEWLLGRWAAKSLARSLPDFSRCQLSALEIRSRPGGAPYHHVLEGTCPPHSLSISHSGDLAFCALTLAAGVSVGADLEKVEPRTDEFLQDYFTLAEWDRVRLCSTDTRDLTANLIWSAKEAMLKALGVGLHWDTRQVEVIEIGGLVGRRKAREGWQDLEVESAAAGAGIFRGWWQPRGDYVLSVMARSAGGINLTSIDLVEARG
jgi:4'-phosphopantetheinyl transferase